MLERIIVAILVKAISWFLEQNQKSKVLNESNNDIDQKLEAFKNAYKESFNGEATTDEQRKNLKIAIRNFIKSDNGGL